MATEGADLLNFAFTPRAREPPSPTETIPGEAIPAMKKYRRKGEETFLPVPFWRPESLTVVDRPEDRGQRSAADADLDPADREAAEWAHAELVAGKPTRTPLAPVSAALAQLRRGAAKSASSAVDLAVVLKSVSRAETLEVLPRVRRRRWGDAILLIHDRSPHLIPFFRDYLDLAPAILAQFRRIQPNAFLWQSDQPPAPEAGTLVVALSDLGTLAPPGEGSQAEWAAYGTALRRAGCHPLAILPASPVRGYRRLAAAWSMAGWRALDEPASAEVIEAQVHRLAVLLSPARRIEPGLLRDIRLLATEPAIGPEAESAFWRSSYLHGRMLDAGEPHLDARRAAFEDFKLLPASLQAAVVATIKRWRFEATDIWRAEILDLGPLAERLDREADLAEAAQMFDRLGHEMMVTNTAKPGDYSFIKRFAGTASSETFAPRRLMDTGAASGEGSWRLPLDRGILRVLVASHPAGEANLPLAYDPALLPALDLPPKRLALRQHLGAILVAEAGSPDAMLGAPLATIEARRNDFALEPLPPFWACGVAPRWADAWGCDDHGPWVDFAVRPKRGEAVVQRMRWVPGGTFQMGSPPDEPGRFGAEGPRHSVTIAQGWWMFDTPVTQSLWRAVMGGRNPSRFKTPGRPVDSVSWEDARAFVDRINGLVPDLALELPSEARWERACRAGTDTALYTGPVDILGFNNAPALDPIAWYGGNSGVDFELPNGAGSEGWEDKQHAHARAGPHRVGRKVPNTWGLYDMIGNVWEWCEDHWHETYDGAPNDGTAWLNPDASGARRVLRGGSWHGFARHCRSASRNASVPDDRILNFGFRCARVQAGAEPGGSRRIRPTERRIAASLSGGAGARRLIVGGPEARAPLPLGAPFVIRSDCEHLTFGLTTRPGWASAMGRDRFGLWTEFQLDDSAWPPVKQRMRWIPPGRFNMGSPEDEPGRWQDEGPRHLVTVSTGFWLFDTSCTQAMWEGVMGENPSRFRSPDRPVETVNWDDAKAFIAKLNERLPGLDLSLPSEAAWEYACRAGTETALYNGPIEIVGERNAPALDAIAWYGGNSGRGFDLDDGYDASDWSEMQYPDTKAGTRVVATRDPNAFGLYDMIGNVWEWCEDHWHGDYDGATSDGSAWLDKAAKSGAGRVLRGGSWLGSAGVCRSASRSADDPAGRSHNFGFRCARVQA